MKNLTTILILFISVNLMAQNWYEQIGGQAKLISKIKEKEDWESIFQYATEELELPEKYLTDILETLEFQKYRTYGSNLDEFFTTICDSVYNEFPYRRSGHLTRELYRIEPTDTSEIAHMLMSVYGNSLYPRFAKIIDMDMDTLLPQLINYVRNDAATRLCVRSRDWNELPYYLSISDIAMEMIEVKTYCDFYDNASHSQKLFSNLEISEQNKIIENLNKWYLASDSLTSIEAIVYFLDEISDVGHSYTYTCNNLKFMGDTVLANSKISERDTFINCAMQLSNYYDWEIEYEDCIEPMLNRANYPYKDRDLSHLVNQDLSHVLQGERTDHLDDWHVLFVGMANYRRNDIPKTLIALMQIRDEVINSDISNKEVWRHNYPKQYNRNFRVCDFALYKYNELIQPLPISDWMNIEERNSMIRQLVLKYRD